MSMRVFETILVRKIRSTFWLHTLTDHNSTNKYTYHMIVKVKANGSVSNAVITTPPTVASFKASHGAAYGVSGNTSVRVNGSSVDEDYVLRDGDEVEFYQVTSSKAAAYSVTLVANGQSQTFVLDSTKTAAQLLEDAGTRAALGLGANTSVRVNGGDKSEHAALSAGDRVEFTQATSSKAA
jgi:sulfur carrier protein ThiS